MIVLDASAALDYLLRREPQGTWTRERVRDVVPRAPHLIDLEFANSEYSLLDTFAETPFSKHIGLGVADVHSHVLEPVDEMADGIRRTLKLIPPERVFVDPDCGLKTRSVEEAKAKLTNIQKAVEIVRAEL